MPSLYNRKNLEPFRKNLRNFSTSAEATLWKHLKQKQLGVKFRRQHSVGNYILDFYCPAAKVAVELDGEKHFTDEGMRYDEERARFLKNLNIKVIRFENYRVFEDLQSVLDEMRAELNHPDPSCGRIGPS